MDDYRESPSFVLIEKLESRGAKVDYNDPYIPVIGVTREHIQLKGRNSVEIDNSYDLILLATNHSEYQNIDFSDYKCPVVDTRNCIRKKPQKYYQA